MNKPRRRVTVDTGKPVSEESEKRKPSVFERLGPGGGQRKYEERGEKSKTQSQSLYLDKCRHWLLTGDCPFGAKCKFQHGPFIAKRPSKSRGEDDLAEDLRLKVKGGDRHSVGSQSPENKSGSRSESRSRHDKETKIKSTVVVKNSTGLDSDEEDSENSDNWDAEVLDYKKELELEKKRQEIQRALSQLAASDGEERENITIEKKVHSKDKPVRESVSFALKKSRQLPPQAFSSDYSNSDSSPERNKTQLKKSPKKISPQGKKKVEKKKHKFQKSPVNTQANKGPRTPSPSEMGKKKEHKKKYDTEDDSPHKIKHKKMKKMEKRMDKSPEVEIPKTKKKHTARIDKFYSEKPPKADKRLLSPDLGSPTGKRSHRSWSPSRSRSRSRSITPTPPKKLKNISPGLKEKAKGEKVKQKKKKGKNKFSSDGGGKDGRVSPVRIKKKKLKTELPFPIKRDIEEDLPARHSDSPGSETLPPRSPNIVSPRRDKPPEREFFKGMLRDREEERRDLVGRDMGRDIGRKTKRKRSESPQPRDRFAPEHGGDIGYKPRKAGPSQDRKFARKDTYGSEIERPKHGEERMRRASPDSFRSEERSPTPTPSTRRNLSPDLPPQRSRSRRDRDDEIDMGRSRDRRSPDERRMGKEARDRREDPDPRAMGSSAQREAGYRDRYDRNEEHRQDPRERYDERFQDFQQERFPERSRFPDEREQYDPRDRHRHDQSFERGRDNRQERFDSRDRFQQDQQRMHQGQGREYFGDRGRAGRGRGRGFDAFQEFGNDRQSRRSEWEDRRRGEVFGQGTRDWGDRHDMRRDMSREERFDNRREDHRFEDRGFRRDDERQMGRDGRPMSRGNDGRSMDRNMREGWRGDMREDRMGMRDERMRDNRMDDRRRHSPSPYEKRGYRDDRFPHDERMFGRDDRGMEDRLRDERGIMDRGRDDRMRDERGMEREMRGIERGRDERGPIDRGMLERGREERGQMDRGRDQSMDERGRGNRRDERIGMDRGREDRMRDDRGSLERADERGFPDDRRRDRGMREDRREDRPFREEDEERFGRDDRSFRDRGREFRDERIGREERRRDDGRDRLSRAESSPENDQTPDRRSRDDRIEKEQDRLSRDGSPKEERPRTSSSRSERSKEKGARDDRSSEKSSKDSRTSRDEKGREDRVKEDKVEKRRKEERSPRRDMEDRSPRREGKKEEKEQWPMKPDHSDEESDGGRLEELRSKETRKRNYEKEEIPVSPIPKRLRDISPASSCRSKGSRSSRYRTKERDMSKPRRRGDSGSDKEDHGRKGKGGSLEREKKFKKKESVPLEKMTEKMRSVSPRPLKDKSDEKLDKGRSKARRRSRSASSSRSKDPQKDTKEMTAEPVKKSEDNLFDEDNISAIVSLGGKSSLAEDEKASDIQSIGSVPFSDWSEDDMADNILNQAEAEAEKLERQKRSPSRVSVGSRSSALDRRSHDQSGPFKERSKDTISQRGGVDGDVDRSVPDKARSIPPPDPAPLDEEMEGMPEYEEISSDEEEFLEEETDKPQSIVNILDIDWSSLKEPAKPKSKGSALQRFTPANIFTQLGVSRAYAGDALFEKIQAVCQKELDEKAKEEGKDEEEKPPEKFVFHDTVAAFHCSALRKIRERADLLRNIGSHRRALCARKDLEIRRKLCKVNKVFDQSPVYPSHVMDTDLCKLSIQLFRQGRDVTPDKKDNDTDVKSEVDMTA